MVSYDSTRSGLSENKKIWVLGAQKKFSNFLQYCKITFFANMHHESFEGFASERIVLVLDEIVIWRAKKYIEMLKTYFLKNILQFWGKMKYFQVLKRKTCIWITAAIVHPKKPCLFSVYIFQTFIKSSRPSLQAFTSFVVHMRSK